MLLKIHHSSVSAFLVCPVIPSVFGNPDYFPDAHHRKESDFSVLRFSEIWLPWSVSRSPQSPISAIPAEATVSPFLMKCAASFAVTNPFQFRSSFVIFLSFITIILNLQKNLYGFSGFFPRNSGSILLRLYRKTSSFFDENSNFVLHYIYSIYRRMGFMAENLLNYEWQALSQLIYRMNRCKKTMLNFPEQFSNRFKASFPSPRDLFLKHPEQITLLP